MPRYKLNKTRIGLVCCKFYNMRQDIKEYLNERYSFSLNWKTQRSKDINDAQMNIKI